MFKRKDTKDNASKKLLLGAKIYADRNKQYGDSFIVVGEVMKALFPNGVHLKTSNDQLRYHLLSWGLGKLVRYCQNFESGGHQDSIDDALVYMAMLAFEDEVIAEEKDKI